MTKIAFPLIYLIINVYGFNYIFTINNSTKLYFEKDDGFLGRLSISQTCLLFGYLTPKSPQKYYPTLINVCNGIKENVKIVAIIDDVLYLFNQPLPDRTIPLIRQIGAIIDFKDNPDQTTSLLYRLDTFGVSNSSYGRKLTPDTPMHLRFIIDDSNFEDRGDQLLEEMLAVLNLFYQPNFIISKPDGNSFIKRLDMPLQDEQIWATPPQDEGGVDISVVVKCRSKYDYSIPNSICTTRSSAIIDICHGNYLDAAYRLHLLINKMMSGSSQRFPASEKFPECLSNPKLQTSALCGNGVVDPGEECDCSFSKELCKLLDPECDTETCLRSFPPKTPNFPKLVGVLRIENISRDKFCRHLSSSDSAVEASPVTYPRRMAEICSNIENCSIENLMCLGILCSVDSAETATSSHLFRQIYDGMDCPGGTCWSSKCVKCPTDSRGRICSSRGICVLGSCHCYSGSKSPNCSEDDVAEGSIKIDVIFLSGSLLTVVIVTVPAVWFLLRKIKSRRYKHKWKFNDRRSIDYWSARGPEEGSEPKFRNVEECINNNIYSDFSKLACHNNHNFPRWGGQQTSNGFPNNSYFKQFFPGNYDQHV